MSRSRWTAASAGCWASAGASSYVAGTLGYLGATNVLLALFNLVPGFALDGGRVLRSLLWRMTGNLRRATRWTTIVADIVAYLFIFFGVLQVFGGNLLGGHWIGLIGRFLLNASQAANNQVVLQSLLQGVTVDRVMRPPSPAVSPGVSLTDPRRGGRRSGPFAVRGGQRGPTRGSRAARSPGVPRSSPGS